MADDIDTLQKTGLTSQTETPPPTAPVQASNPEQTRVAGEMPRKTQRSTSLILVFGLVIVLSGVGTGYAMAELMPRGSGDAGGTSEITPTSEDEIQVGVVYGMKDEETFSDDVEGILVKGGIDGEGSHHLIRPGGTSQTVYLTSSVLDLDPFVGAKVEIKGETFQAQKAGWLLDVGQVKVLELNVGNPEETKAAELPEE